MPARIHWFRGTAALGIALGAPPSGGAQVPSGSDTLSATAVADSLAVLRDLDARLKTDRQNATVWHRRGMIAWALAARGKLPEAPKGLDPTKLGRLADTSLRIAANLAQNNVDYQLAAGRFLIASGTTMSRAGAAPFFDAALTISRASGSARQRAMTAVEAGRVYWRRYDALANRRMTTTIADVGRSLSDAMQPVARVARALEEAAERNRADEALAALHLTGNNKEAAAALAAATASEQLHAQANARGGVTFASTPAEPLKAVIDLIQSSTFALPAAVTGGNDFARADSLFAEAYAADITFEPAFRARAMALAEKNKWTELETIARSHVAQREGDAHAWMSLGLALHRQGRASAAAAFDSAFARFEDSDRRRLSDLARIMPSARARRATVGGRAERNLFWDMYWASVDPLWSDENPEWRSEFRARVAFAELRWTIDEIPLLGADTDRGDIYVRYGPPEIIAVIGPNVSEAAADIMTFWIYKSGLIFGFSGLTGFGTARIPINDLSLVEGIKEATPVKFDNLPSVRPDSILMRTARFRSSPSSVDVHVAAALPATLIRASMADSTNVPVRGDVWLRGEDGRMAFHETVALRSTEIRAWTPRVDRGTYLVRVEATGPGARRAGRAAAQFETERDFTVSGAGISDVLMASLVTETGGKAVTRWRDYSIVPSVGVVDRGGTLALVWESYDFGLRNGISQYSVAITVTRERGGVSGIAARIAGALASLARVETSPDRVVLRYTRDVQAASIIPDNVSIAFGTTPAGSYRVALDVTDLTTNKTYSRTGTVTVR